MNEQLATFAATRREYALGDLVKVTDLTGLYRIVAITKTVWECFTEGQTYMLVPEQVPEIKWDLQAFRTHKHNLITRFADDLTFVMEKTPW
jgi:ribosomal 30S subunit maturation factor RimM